MAGASRRHRLPAGHAPSSWLLALLVAAAAAAAPARGGGEAHYWPQARGIKGEYMLTRETLPRNLSSAFAWKFSHPESRFASVMRGNPLIDAQKNVLILTENGLFKLDQHGSYIWHYIAPTTAIMNVVPCMVDDIVYGMAQDTLVYALNLTTGEQLWLAKYGDRAGPDTAYVGSRSGVLLAAIDMCEPRLGGNLRVLGMNTSAEGALLWEYRIGIPTWNFNPLFPDDESFIYMDISGGVARVNLHTGKVMWVAQVPDRFLYSFTDGGVMMSPDGSAAFACSNNEDDKAGVLRAYRMTDGFKLWEKHLPTGCTSWPVIARTGDWGVLPAGHFVSEPLALKLPLWMPERAKLYIHLLSLRLGAHMQTLLRLFPWYGVRSVHTEIIAFDTRTGDTLWNYRTPDWRRMAAKGDEEGLLERSARGRSIICLPTTWGTPTLSGDDTVYVGHCSGILYAVKDHNGDGRIDPESEVSTFDMDAGPLPNNPAWAPGMMAVASCDTLFVFKS